MRITAAAASFTSYSSITVSGAVSINCANFSASQFDCTFGSIAPLGAIDAQLVVTVAPEAPSGTVFTETFTVSSDNDTRLTNNSVTVSTILVKPKLATVGLFRGGSWYLNMQNDASNPEFSFPFGASTDIPVVGDWNCNGTKTAGVFNNGAWYLNNQNDGSAPDTSFFFGAAGDIPVVGDWDGNGCDSVGIFRNGLWYLTNATSGSPAINYSFFFGAPGDKPVTGDWDNNGTTGIGVFRGGYWYLSNTITGSPVPNYTFGYGVGTDMPVVGDWTGSGTVGIGVFRNAVWYLNNQLDGSGPEFTFGFGAATDIPLTGSWGAPGNTVREAGGATPLVSSCASSFSCQPGPNDWYGARSLGDPKAPTLRGWTGLNEPPPAPGWTGLASPAQPPTPGWTGSGGSQPSGNQPSLPLPLAPTAEPGPGPTKKG